MNKSEVRQLFLEKRKNLNQSEYLEKNHAIFSGLRKSHDLLADTQLAHIFLCIPEMNEPNTEPLIHYLWENGIDTCVPKMEASGNQMSAIAYSPTTSVKKGRFSTRQPESSRKIDPKSIDLIFLPLLAFDLEGNRIGYGKGFYDAFIPKCRSNVLKVGLSLFGPAEHIPTESHDIPMDYCIGPEEVYRFS